MGLFERTAKTFLMMFIGLMGLALIGIGSLTMWFGRLIGVGEIVTPGFPGFLWGNKTVKTELL